MVYVMLQMIVIKMTKNDMSILIKGKSTETIAVVQNMSIAQKDRSTSSL